MYDKNIYNFFDIKIYTLSSLKDFIDSLLADSNAE